LTVEVWRWTSSKTRALVTAPPAEHQDRLEHAAPKLAGVIDGRGVDAIGSPRTISEQKQRPGLDAREHLASEQHNLDRGEPAPQEVANLVGVVVARARR